MIALTILLIILGAAFFLADKEDAGSAYPDYEGNFAVENIEDVHHIVLTHGRERQIDLKRTSSGWIVNDGYKARMSSVEPLLEVIRSIEIKYIPPKAAVEHITWDIAAHGIQADIYDDKGTLLKSYYVGGATFDDLGTHVRMADSDQPFVTHIRSMDGSFRPRFNLTLDEWRDRRFLNIDPDQIDRVEVQYPRQKSQSFILQNTGNSYTVSPMFPDRAGYPTEYRAGSAENFIRELTNAACESYNNQYPSADSVRTLVPFSSIGIIMKDTVYNVRLNIYPKGNPVISEFSSPYHRMFIDMVPGDFLLVQYDVIKGFLRGYDYFFEGPDHELVL